MCMLDPWHKLSVLGSRPPIMLVWRRLWADRNRAQKHVARARIILGSADRLSVAEVARGAGVGRRAVWRWQRRFAEAGVDGLLRDATRKPDKARLDDATVGSADSRLPCDKYD
jgi:hypothetical protein